MYTCCRYYGLEGLQGHEGDASFTVEVNHFTFGPGCLREAGSHARALGMRRVALYADKQVNALPYVATVKRSLEAAGCEVAIYWECEVEPTDRSFRAAAKFAQEGHFDGFVSVGGGSVMDTTKAANLYATYPDDFLAYVNAPIGQGKAVPGPLKPHIACPTTCGTGSEVTGIAIFDLLEQQCKTGILSRHLLPSRALVDPDVTHTLSPAIIAANGFDALSHALESLWNRNANPMSAGYAVTAAARPREALDLLHANPAAIDLVLTDFTMPEMTGIALAAEVRRLAPALPVILMTGLVDEEVMGDGRSPQIRRVLQKPTDPRELIATVGAVLEESRAGAPPVPSGR